MASFRLSSIIITFVISVRNFSQAHKNPASLAIGGGGGLSTARSRSHSSIGSASSGSRGLPKRRSSLSMAATPKRDAEEGAALLELGSLEEPPAEASSPPKEVQAVTTPLQNTVSAAHDPVQASKEPKNLAHEEGLVAISSAKLSLQTNKVEANSKADQEGQKKSSVEVGLKQPEQPDAQEKELQQQLQAGQSPGEGGAPPGPVAKGGESEAVDPSASALPPQESTPQIGGAPPGNVGAITSQVQPPNAAKESQKEMQGIDAKRTNQVAPGMQDFINHEITDIKPLEGKWLIMLQSVDLSHCKSHENETGFIGQRVAWCFSLKIDEMDRRSFWMQWLGGNKPDDEHGAVINPDAGAQAGSTRGWMADQSYETSSFSRPLFMYPYKSRYMGDWAASSKANTSEVDMKPHGWTLHYTGKFMMGFQEWRFQKLNGEICAGSDIVHAIYHGPEMWQADESCPTSTFDNPETWGQKIANPSSSARSLREEGVLLRLIFCSLALLPWSFA